MSGKMKIYALMGAKKEDGIMSFNGLPLTTIEPEIATQFGALGDTIYAQLGKGMYLAEFTMTKVINSWEEKNTDPSKPDLKIVK